MGARCPRSSPGAASSQGATVKLARAGQADIIGDPVQVDAGGSAIATTFDLTGSAIGAWDVVVTNPDGASLVLVGGFSTEAGGVPDLWVNVIGSLRREGPSRLTILYGNRGTVDAIAAPLSLSVPEEYSPTRSFAIAPPPPQAGQLRDDWSQVPMTVRADPQSGFVNIPLLLPVVPAGFSGVLQIGLTFPADAPESQLVVAIGDPLFAPDLDAAFVSDAVAGAEAYLLNDGVTIPPALVPDLELYVSDQMKQIVEAGRNAFVASLGSESQVYSMSQLHFDLVFHAAIRARNAQASAAGTTFPWLHEIPRSLVALLSRLGPGEVRAQGQNCPVDDPKRPRGSSSRVAPAAAATSRSSLPRFPFPPSAAGTCSTVTTTRSADRAKTTASRWEHTPSCRVTTARRSASPRIRPRAVRRTPSGWHPESSA